MESIGKLPRHGLQGKPAMYTLHSFTSSRFLCSMSGKNLWSHGNELPKDKGAEENQEHNDIKLELEQQRGSFRGVKLRAINFIGPYALSHDDRCTVF